MQCPACDNALQPITVGTLTVDGCDGGCGGLWFDAFELKRVDETHESTGESLLDLRRDANLRIDADKRRSCPKCPSMVMMRHYTSPKKLVLVDECPSCGGFWLDAGELAALRSEHATEVERDQAMHERLSEMFDPLLDEAGTLRQERLDQSLKLARALRFICPSNYLPGKQSWGAF